MSKAENSVAIAAYLREEGYVPKVDEAGDIMFKYQGSPCFIDFLEDDEGYFSVIQYADRLKTEEQVQKAIWLANKLSLEYKVAKIVILGPNKDGERPVRIVAESFSSSIDNTKSILPRLLAAVNVVAGKFYSEFGEV